ncbi:MAG: type II secretion system protein [Sedimentisphaeraceae bacterium JB056]
MSRCCRKGFTLIELLVVISIIAVLLAVMMPALQKAKEQAKTVVCKSRLHDLSLGYSLYFQDFDNYIPPSYTLKGLPVHPQYYPDFFEQYGYPQSRQYLSYRQTILPLLMDNLTFSYEDQLDESLWEYAGDDYSCPSVKGLKDADYWISYAQSAHIGGWRIDSVKRPSSAVLLVDVGPAKETNLVYANIWIDYPGIENRDNVAYRHGGDFNVLFCDLSIRRNSDEYSVVWKRDGKLSERQ